MGGARVDGDVVYRRLQALGCAFAHRLARWEVKGLDAIPKLGPAIIAANHVSYLDPPLLASLVPRPIRFVAKKEVFAVPFLGRFLRWIGTFPVERDRPDIKAVRESLRVLDRGELLGIFPEGTRHKRGGLGSFLEGVGWLGIKARVPVIPIAIYGYVPLRDGSTWTRPGRLQILCGRPLKFPVERYASGKRPYRTEATREVYRAIRALLTAAGKERSENSAVGSPLGSGVPAP